MCRFALESIVWESGWTGCLKQWSNFEGVADQAVVITH